MKYYISKIVVATNFSPEADNALNYAIELAKKHNANLDLVHAISPSESRNKKPQFVGAAYERLKKYRDDILSKHQLVIKIYARVGGVTEFLNKYCIENKSDLLIIGVQTMGKKYFSDSKTYSIVKKINCPVLTIPLNFKKLQFGNVLFPVRDVQGVKEKLSYSKPFLDKDHAELHLICFGQPDLSKMEELIEAAKNNGITSYIPQLSPTSTKNVPMQVIATAKEKEDDLIVINATKEKEWYNIFGENYTEYILKEASMPVLSIVHPFESGLS